MPLVRMRSTSTGEIFAVDSSDPALLSAWVLEMLGRINPQENTPAQVTIRPRWMSSPTVGKGQEADWPVDHDVHLIGAAGTDGLRQLAKSLTDHANMHDHDEEERRNQEAEYAEGERLLSSESPTSAQG